MSKQIGYVVGSLRKDSWNRKLANALIRLGPPDFHFKELRIGDLPLYDQDDDRSQAPEVQRLKTELRGVDAVIFVTPEYNRSVPGVLKNAIDHASRPPGQSAWSGKPAGVLLLEQLEGGRAADLVYLGVVPEARGCGLGYELTCKAMFEAKAVGAAELTLCVDARNAPARRIYDQLGFVEFDRREVFLALFGDLER